MSRPPRPGSSAAPQGRPDRKPSSGQLLPVVICVVLIVTLAFVYHGVRAARLAVAPPDRRDVTAVLDAGHVRLTLPYRWHTATQDNVARASGRWAAGPRGATDRALFVTRYPLNRVPGSRHARQQVLAEARGSLRLTGAPRLGEPTETEIDGREGWRMRYRRGDHRITTWLLLDREDGRAVLYQLSCQFLAGSAAERACVRGVQDARFS